MKKYLFTTVLFLSLATFSYAQKNANWEHWNWLLGKWQGEGEGRPGKGGGIFSFTYDLGKKVIVRKSHSEYPATTNKPAIVHEDLLVIYMDAKGDPSKAIYFDNEGQSIQYNISYTDKTIVFVSEKTGNTPIFRLTYSQLGNDLINTKFELSQDGEKFATYIEGKSKKIK